MNCYDIRDALLSGSLDLGIFYENVGGFGDNLTTVSLGDCPLVLVASPETKNRFPDFITPGQTLPVPFLINETACIFRQIFEEYLRKKAIVLGHTIELWSIPTIKNLVMSNMGVTCLPVFTVMQELTCGTLVEIPTEIAGTSIHAVCGYRKNMWKSPAAELFLKLLAEQSL